MAEEIKIDYTAQNGDECALFFERPTYAQIERMRARWKFLRARWENTELAKRIQAWRKDNGEGEIPDQDFWALASGCPEEDFQKQSDLGLVGIDQAIALVRGWEVKGEKVDKPFPEIIDDLSRIKNKGFLYSVMGKAVLEIFDIKESNEEDAS